MKASSCIPILVGVFLSGCATPKEINGHKVIRTLWRDGRVVYVVEGDKEALKRGVADAKAAGVDVVIAPLK